MPTSRFKTCRQISENVWYMIAFLICESFMIAMFCMLDLLLFYVFSKSILIPMLCGVERLIFTVRSTASAGALCSKPLWAM